MGKHSFIQYPSLVFADESNLSELNFPNKSVQLKILEALAMLDLHGTQSGFMGKKVENTGRLRIWELKVKGPSKTEWRFLFKRIPSISDDPSTHRYGLLNFFQKTTEEISKRDFDSAVRIANREGW